MQCIDAIEGVVKCILRQWHTVSVENKLDDSEYVHNVKAAIAGTRQYLSANPEMVENPQLLVDVLYQFSRDLWLGERRDDSSREAETKNVDSTPANEEYQTYYYDFLYHRGVFPQ